MSRAKHRHVRANRLNAKKSTGPRTHEGKAKSRLNALKHGILAESIIIPDCERLESTEKFDAILKDLTEELKPVGFLEEILVEQVAVCYWRLRRAVRAEAGKIAERIEDSSRFDPECPVESLSLPAMHMTHMIIRYETTIERRMHRALSALYVKQVRRKANAASLAKETPDSLCRLPASNTPPEAGEFKKIPNEPNSLQPDASLKHTAKFRGSEFLLHYGERKKTTLPGIADH